MLQALLFSASLADPPGSSPLTAAVTWLQGTLLGTVATTVAVIAVASVGYLTLTGRVNVRHGATVVGGCFILFGATSIVAGLRQAADMGGLGGAEQVAEAPPPPPAFSPPPLPPRPAQPSDPYAGASLIR